MEPLDERQSRRILEVAAHASPAEIDRAYRLLLQIHSDERGIHAAPAMEEFDPETRKGILEQIELAYRLLTRLQPGSPVSPASPEPQGSGPADWTALRRARDAAGLSLDQVVAETHVRREYVRALEEEDFEHLRLPTVNVRGYLTAYLQAVGLAVEAMLPGYMEKFQHWQRLH